MASNLHERKRFCRKYRLPLHLYEEHMQTMCSSCKCVMFCPYCRRTRSLHMFSTLTPFCRKYSHTPFCISYKLLLLHPSVFPIDSFTCSALFAGNTAIHPPVFPANYSYRKSNKSHSIGNTGFVRTGDAGGY